MLKRFPFLILLLVFMVSCGKNASKGSGASSSKDIDITAIQTAKEAYIFAFPLVVMDITARKMTDANNKDGVAKNVFFHKSYFPDETFRDVVRPNADTYYSSASLDLSNGPVVLSVPDTKGRYYMVPILDAYTNVIETPGSRTTGTKANNFLITGPGWEGTAPSGMKQIKLPTNMGWIIGRTQVNSVEDGEKVVIPLQKQYKLTPLSAWGTVYTPPKPTPDNGLSKDDPNTIIEAMPIDSFFNYFNALMAKYPPTAADQPALKKFASIGLTPGGKFKMDSFNEATQEALKKIPVEFVTTAKEAIEHPSGLVNGWNLVKNSIGTYGTDYASRAIVAYGGLGANQREDAAYPSAAVDADGNRLNGANKYVIHFEKGKTPPARAFWSFTMYDPDGYMVANPIHRNTIGDRSNLIVNADGSIDIYVQHTSPGKDKDRNWLPAPVGDFNVLLRVYFPKPEMLNFTWAPPAVVKMK